MGKLIRRVNLEPIFKGNGYDIQFSVVNPETGRPEMSAVLPNNGRTIWANMRTLRCALNKRYPPYKFSLQYETVPIKHFTRHMRDAIAYCELEHGQINIRATKRGKPGLCLFGRHVRIPELKGDIAKANLYLETFGLKFVQSCYAPENYMLSEDLSTKIGGSCQ